MPTETTRRRQEFRVIMGPRTNHPIPVFFRVSKMYLTVFSAFATILSVVWLPLLSNGDSSGDDPTLTLRCDLALGDVVPREKQTGRVITGLNRGDCAIFDAGVKQTVSHWSGDNVPVSVGLRGDPAGCV